MTVTKNEIKKEEIKKEAELLEKAEKEGKMDNPENDPPDVVTVENW